MERSPGNGGYAVGLLGIVTLAFIWSGIHPKDRYTWVLEVFPVVLAAPILLATYRHFPLTRLTYTLIAIHSVILVIGGHYTYAEVPLFNWLRDTLHLSRNHYDRLGHFAQGFVPAILAREILLRRSPLTRGKWLFAIVVSICLAISASYELLECAVSIISDKITGEGAVAFLGTQGDPWDTQEDMAMAAIGAVTALLTLPRRHDRQLAKLTPSVVQSA